jgi:hypothetical protein
MQVGDNQKPGSVAESNLAVSVSLNGVTVQFHGSIESVLSSVMTFISKQIPSLELANRISLNYSTTELIDQFGSYIKLTPEGPIVDPDTARMRLSDKQIVALYLVAMKISKELGKSENDKVTVSHIQSATALNPKSISSRLSELVKFGHVLKDVKKDTSQSGSFYISTAGIHWLALSFGKKNSLG